jgi:hypothetical protein
MMKLINLTLPALLLLFSTRLIAQADPEVRLKAINTELTKTDTGWVWGGSIGLDLSGMGLFNPRQGAGGNRLGIGSIAQYSARYSNKKLFWSNQLDIRLGAQRVEVPLTEPVPTTRTDFVKNLDLIRVNSRLGYTIKGGRVFSAVDFVAESILLPLYPGNTIIPVNQGDKPRARFLSPLTVDIAPGLAFNPTKQLNLFFSPAAVRYILVSDPQINALFVHVTQNSLTGDNYFLGLGAKLRASYAHKFLEDHVALNTNLSLFTNYLNSPENIDVLWTTNLDFQIYKGLSLGLLGELFYDHDVNVQIDRNGNGIFGEKANNEFAPAASITGSFMLKYSRIF